MAGGSIANPPSTTGNVATSYGNQYPTSGLMAIPSAGNGRMPASYQTNVPQQQFNTAMYRPAYQQMQMQAPQMQSPFRSVAYQPQYQQQMMPQMSQYSGAYRSPFGFGTQFMPVQQGIAGLYNAQYASPMRAANFAYQPQMTQFQTPIATAQKARADAAAEAARLAALQQQGGDSGYGYGGDGGGGDGGGSGGDGGGSGDGGGGGGDGGGS